VAVNSKEENSEDFCQITSKNLASGEDGWKTWEEGVSTPGFSLQHLFIIFSFSVLCFIEQPLSDLKIVGQHFTSKS
jgi:hypothetical protein